MKDCYCRRQYTGENCQVNSTKMLESKSKTTKNTSTISAIVIIVASVFCTVVIAVVCYRKRVNNLSPRDIDEEDEIYSFPQLPRGNLYVPPSQENYYEDIENYYDYAGKLNILLKLVGKFYSKLLNLF